MTKTKKISHRHQDQTLPVVEGHLGLSEAAKLWAQEGEDNDKSKLIPVGVISIDTSDRTFFRITNLGSQVVKVGANRRPKFEILGPSEATHVKVCDEFGITLICEPLSAE